MQYLFASLIILSLLCGWLLVQHLARRYARLHPELGRYREEGGGCGGGLCRCRGKKACPRNNKHHIHPH